MKTLREDNRKMRRKIKRLEQSSLTRVKERVHVESVTDNAMNTCNDNSAVPCPTDNSLHNHEDIRKSLEHLKTDQDIFRALCLTFFTKDELKNSSRTGKKQLSVENQNPDHH